MIAKTWKNFSISAKLYFVVGTMALLIVMELLTLKFSMNKLSAVRTFVGGEGSWSKAQRNAVHQIQQYIVTRDEKYYRGFQQALLVPAGDRTARNEIEKPNPDYTIVRKGFIQGHIHPDDIDQVIVLLRQFSWISYIKEARVSWTLGDSLLVELSQEADEFHQLATTNQLTPEKAKKITEKIDSLNHQMTLAEANFSAVLGEGSRWLERVIFVVLFGLVLTVECVGLTLTFFTSRSISRGLHDLIEVAQSISQGNFDKKLEVRSNDEIGQLTMAVNEMGSVLQKNYNELTKSHEELEKKVETRTAELNIALKSRDEFLSIASHEFRTPLTAVSMQLDMIARTMKKNEPRNESLEAHLNRAINQVNKMIVLQSVLMDVTAMRNGKLELKKSQIDLTEVVADSIAQLEFDAEKADIVISYEKTGPMVGEFDPTRMGQVVSNLLSNAIKYGAGKPVEVYSKIVDGWFVIAVKDNGDGISHEKHAKIFERFERLHRGDDVPGLGLGLYIAKQIIEAHSGKLCLKSEIGKGTTFEIVLKT